MGLTLHPLTVSNTYCLFFKSTPGQPRRRHGRTGALARDAAAGHLRGNEMPGLKLLVQRLARKRLARDRDPPEKHD